MSTPALLQSLEKKLTASMPERIKHHHCQFSYIPCCLISPVMYRGVSEEKVVATMEVPASHHGRLRPERKKSLMLPEARRVRYTPMARLTLMPLPLREEVTAMGTPIRANTMQAKGMANFL